MPADVVDLTIISDSSESSLDESAGRRQPSQLLATAITPPRPKRPTAQSSTHRQSHSSPKSVQSGRRVLECIDLTNHDVEIKPSPTQASLTVEQTPSPTRVNRSEESPTMRRSQGTVRAVLNNILQVPWRQTPRKPEWDAAKIAEQLQSFAKELSSAHELMCHRVFAEVEARETWVLDGDDLFGDMTMNPVPEEKGLTLRAKFKQHTSGRKLMQQGKRELHLKAICLRTETEAVPPYRFHHIAIPKNVLTPHTMLKFVPHLRDLESSEERKYNLWLRELEEMDEASGFKPLSREQKVVKMTQDEYAATLSSVLPTWLHRLSIDGCNKSTLIRYMASHEQEDVITPQQKTEILISQSQSAEPESPKTARAARLFTEAFDSVFNAPERKPRAVTLSDVLVLDEAVDTIMDSKKLPRDGQPLQTNASYDFNVEKHLETHTLLSCLLCFSHSCDHGEYDAKNSKRVFSLEAWGGIEGTQKRRRMLSGSDRYDPSLVSTEPCGSSCFLHQGLEAEMSSATPSSLRSRDGERWTTRDTRMFRALAGTMATTKSARQASCNAAVYLQRSCKKVHAHALTHNLYPSSVPPPGLQVITPVKNLPWYDRHKKMLLGDWQEHTISHEHQRKELLEPCNHEGPCTVARKCPCVLANVLCDRFCRCTANSCAYKFTGCACHSNGKTCHSRQKDRPCICVQLNRECDPGLCRSCGSLERADPLNGDNQEMMETGCQNCALQRGKEKAVILAKSQLDGVGYGLITAEDIAQDDFVMEYTGELITHDEGVRREARRGDVFNEESNSSYLFTLLEHEGIWVDAAVYGNLSRYINHASESDKRGCNITPKILYVNGEYRIRFSALRDIKAGEELFFNYGENFPNLTKQLLEDRVDQEDAPAANNMGRRPGRPSRTGLNGRASRSQDRRAPRKPPRRKKPTGVRKAAPQEPQQDSAPEEAASPMERRHRRKRKRKAEEEDEEEEYQPEVADSQDGVSDSEPAEATAARSSGRPKKKQRHISPERVTATGTPGEDEAMATPSKAPNPPRRKRGRPRKRPVVVDSSEEAEAAGVAEAAKKVRGALEEEAPKRTHRRRHRVSRRVLDTSSEAEMEADGRLEGEEDSENKESPDESGSRSRRRTQRPARYRVEDDS